MATKNIVAAFAVLAIAPLALIRPVAAQNISSATTLPDKEDPKTAEVRKQLQGYYDEMGKGFALFDPVAATKYYAADYHAFDKDRSKQTRDDMRKLYKTVLSHALRSELKTEITTCTLVGDTATAQTRMHLRAYVRRDDGTEALIEGEMLNREFWMKRKGAWQIKQARIFDFSLKLNGQPFAEN